MDDECLYYALGEEEASLSKPAQSRESRTFHQQHGIQIGNLALYITLLTLFGMIVVDLIWGRQSSNPLIESSNCGATPSEAKAKGCIFDLMSWCWLPPACHDETLSREILDWGPWLWYEDVKATRPVAQDIAALGEIDILYVEESFHQTHCTYIWKKMHRAYLAQRAIDSYIGGFNHTIHCSGVLLRQGVAWNQVDTSVVLKYPTCDDIRIAKGI